MFDASDSYQPHVCDSCDRVTMLHPEIARWVQLVVTFHSARIHRATPADERPKEKA